MEGDKREIYSEGNEKKQLNDAKMSHFIFPSFFYHLLYHKYIYWIAMGGGVFGWATAGLSGSWARQKKKKVGWMVDVGLFIL